MQNGFTMKLVLFFLVTTLCMGILGMILGLFPYFAPLPFEADSEGVTAKPSKRVIIDAGHGGEDGGTSGANGLVEKDVNLSIAFLLRDMLEANGIEVILTRSEDRLLYDRTVDFQGRKKKLDFAARLKIIEDNPDALFISIHMNAFADPRYSGLQVWYSQNDQSSLRLADLIQNNNKTLLQPQNNRKTKGAGTSIYLLDKAIGPAVLVECGFLSNSEEAAKFQSREYRQQVAFVIFCSLTEFFQNQG